MGIRWEMHLDLEQLAARVKAATPDAIRAGLRPIADEATRGVPVGHEEDTQPGMLRDSQQTMVDGDTGSITYHGRAVEKLHEDLTLHHVIGHAKWLEIPMVAEKDKALDNIAQVIREAL